MEVIIKDVNLAGDVQNEIKLEFEEIEVEVKEIISQRVKKEVEAYNNKSMEYFNGLVEPSRAEKTLNGYKLKKRRSIDVEQQVYVALDAFMKNGYFVLINDYQAESLEEKIMLKPDTEVHFIKLTPLVGG